MEKLEKKSKNWLIVRKPSSLIRKTKQKIMNSKVRNKEYHLRQNIEIKSYQKVLQFLLE